MPKEIKQYISQRFIRFETMPNGDVVSFWECVVEYPDGTITTVMEKVTETEQGYTEIQDLSNTPHITPCR